ncbi:MAG: hypothetical protein ACRDVG_16030 [Jatrophihabitantaceae bacterium]
MFVIADHFDSQGGDQSADGRYQYPARSSQTQRAGRAAAVHGFVRSILSIDRSPQVLVVGDLNDYQFSPALKILETGTDAGGPRIARRRDVSGGSRERRVRRSGQRSRPAGRRDLEVE